MIPLKINNRQYYFRNNSGDEYSSSRSVFYTSYIKEKLVKKRKYFFFGKVISEKIVKKTLYKYCFEFNIININTFLSDTNLINNLKLVEENFQNRSNLLEGKVSI